eukprot:TRINITY_DN3804_c1_g2_i1.p1 TRINITY_DN3804_c1_g2~~TRINITY_DN3804_c1_g2_i1.p1  ORF type:complete len:347 (-),score=57.00 TRINITY_DN3804_c1_g2_i1:42-1082(-)
MIELQNNGGQDHPSMPPRRSVVVTVVNLAGDLLLEVQAPDNADVSWVKVKIKELSGHPLFSQRLVMRDGCIASNSMALRGLDQTDAVSFTLVIQPCDGQATCRALSAARKNDFAGVSEALEQNADPDRRDKIGRTALYLAARNGDDSIVAALLRGGADVDLPTKDANSATPLYIASHEGRLEVACRLCKAGAKVNVATPEGATPLYIAAHKGHLEIVKVLCQAGASLNQSTLNGMTPLHVAARKGRLEIVIFLSEASANLNLMMCNGTTPLHLAARQGHLAIVDHLCKAGADRDLASKSGSTALHIAAHQGCMKPCHVRSQRLSRTMSLIGLPLTRTQLVFLSFVG